MKDFFIALVFLSIGTYALTKLLVFVAMRAGLIEVIDDALVPSVVADLLPESFEVGRVVASNGSAYVVIATSGDGKRFELSAVADPYATDVGLEIDIDTVVPPSASSKMLVYDAALGESIAVNVPSSRWRSERSADGLASTQFAFAA